jgi:hypothetical protein
MLEDSNEQISINKASSLQVPTSSSLDSVENEDSKVGATISDKQTKSKNGTTSENESSEKESIKNIIGKDGSKQKQMVDDKANDRMQMQILRKPDALNDSLEKKYLKKNYFDENEMQQL